MKVNGYLLARAVVAALGGFLFGFDTVVISGAEQIIQRLWSLSPSIHGLAMGSCAYGTVLGSLVGGWPADRFGRKNTLFFIGLLDLLSAVGCGLAGGVGMFIAARFIGGLGIGISTVVAPMYISEIAPPAFRGRLAGMFQFNIVFGIVIAFASNAVIARIGEKMRGAGCSALRLFLPLVYSAAVPRPAGKPAVVDQPQGRPHGGP